LIWRQVGNSFGDFFDFHVAQYSTGWVERRKEIGRFRLLRVGLSSFRCRCPSWQRSQLICWTWLRSFDLTAPLSITRGPEHGRTIPLAVIPELGFHPCSALAGRILPRLPFANVQTAVTAALSAGVVRLAISSQSSADGSRSRRASSLLLVLGRGPPPGKPKRAR
jgi:hypothetical protein